MKKILPFSILLITLFVVSLVPTTTLAQQPLECVKLKRDIQFEDSKCDKTTGTSPDPIDDICAKDHIVGTKNGYCEMIKCNNPDSTPACPATGAIADYMPSSWGQGGKTVILDDNTVTKADITERWGLIALINTLNAIVDWIFMIMIVLAVLLSIWGAMNIVMSGGDPGKVGTGRNYIMYAAVGLFVAFIARAIPNFVKSLMGY